jgi:hypothetical protein
MAVLALSARVSMAATGGSSVVTLAALATSRVQVLDAAVSLSPTTTDYDNGYVEITGASGVRVNVRTNSAGGLVLKVRCGDASPRIALTDLLFRTTTAPGTGGTTIAAYTAIKATDQNLWSSGVPVHGWSQVNMDVRIQNIGNYDDPLGAGTTTYTNTLTYTVVSL